jgi:hypothetical protein
VISLERGRYSENFTGFFKAFHAKELFTDNGFLDELFALDGFLLADGLDLLFASDPNAVFFLLLLLCIRGLLFSRHCNFLNSLQSKLFFILLNDVFFKK